MVAGAESVHGTRITYRVALQTYMMALNCILAVLNHCAHQQITVIDKTLKIITCNSLDGDRDFNNIPGEQQNYSNDLDSYYIGNKLSSITVIKM
eukprot:1926826-Pyramimonas_sp.AAC.1